MPDREDLDKLAMAQNRAVELAQTDLSKLWDNLKGLEARTQRDLLLETIPALVERHGDIAATAAAEWYETVRRKDTGQSRYEAVLADCFPSQAVQDSIRWKAGVLWDDPEQMARFLMNATDRWVKYSGRATIMQNVSRDHARYAIVPQGKACAYCTMIASRGFDYHRLETAKAAMHDHCGCQPCPQWDAKKCYISGYDEDALRDQYKQAVKAVDKDRPAYLDSLHANGRENEILEVMRRQHPSEYTDGVHGYSPDRKGRSKRSVGDLNLATWADYRASLAERFIAANDPEWKLPPEQPAEVPRWWRDDPDLPELTVNHLNHLLYGSGKRWADYRASLAERFIAANDPEWKLPPEQPAEVPRWWRDDPDLPELTVNHLNHLLYGSGKRRDTGKRGSPHWTYSGGHMHGYGWIADRPEFPADWDEQRILKAAKEACKHGELRARTKIITFDNYAIIAAFNGKGRLLSIYPRRDDYGQ